MVTGKNFVINAAARFLAASVVGIRAFSVHKTVDEAIELLREA
jgi:hypothetical protein